MYEFKKYVWPTRKLCMFYKIEQFQYLIFRLNFSHLFVKVIFRNNNIQNTLMQQLKKKLGLLG